MSGRRLILVRHATTEPGEVDISRRLTEHGRSDAREIGRWLVTYDLVPDLVVVSPAARAGETWSLAAAELPRAPRLVVDDRVYANSAQNLVDIVREVDESVAVFALVGHNPSVQSVALRWAARREGGAAFPADVATGSVAVFTVDGTWRDVSATTVALSMFATCRG